MKFQWTFVLGLIFALIIAIFAVVNVAAVPVNFLFTTIMFPLVIIILGSALLGALISGSFAIYKSYSGRRRIQELEAQVAQLQAQLDAKSTVISEPYARPAEEPSSIATDDIPKRLQ